MEMCSLFEGITGGRTRKRPMAWPRLGSPCHRVTVHHHTGHQFKGKHWSEETSLNFGFCNLNLNHHPLRDAGVYTEHVTVFFLRVFHFNYSDLLKKKKKKNQGLGESSSNACGISEWTRWKTNISPIGPFWRFFRVVGIFTREDLSYSLVAFGRADGSINGQFLLNHI